MQQETLPLACTTGILVSEQAMNQVNLLENIRPETLSLREKEAVFSLARQLAVKDWDKTVLQSASSATRLCVDYFRGFTVEHFVVIFLTSQNQVIKVRDYGSGTVNQCPVFPREIARDLLILNASAVILSHNHPSGLAEASQADRAITELIKEAIALFDGRVLDHIIVGHEYTYSFAEHGLL